MNDDKNNQYDPNEGTLETIKARPVTLKDDYKFFNKNIFFRLLSLFFIFSIKIFVEYLIARPFMGFRVKNKKYAKSLKKEGYVIISNHIHPIDTFMIGTTVLPKKIYAIMRESNLGVPIFGKVMRFSGGVPIPTKMKLFGKFLRLIPNELKSKKAILVMPETALIPYHVGIRPFSSGAFRIAINANSKILPVVYVYKKQRFLSKIFRSKPDFQLHFLEPVEVLDKGNTHDTVEFYKNYLHEVMTKYFNENSDLI
ncbi:predicted lysophospholipid acyltransferases (LPLATs) of glycerophospholipid biosynthesis,: AGPAT-like [Alteracholeplasma palmae J233]|uniref:Predicted lysophospholipid acyltransferases (LPLATs) of glycerophospholipid biosynthesis,: AGPAT-like n=1 Tax=Alteracholeplasma palmae (strain ATCC 49389 / J233) TaxID=1318466 RepID=U4KS07_ALTPJ|nr:lysophospholipid acyltransferase family protein [Alteracholeplasma palmae]CCV64611.1 predicted lysophospholipid acyltransferases (LPLATs) of glycerophospholipid biosynthesis,: AGPAT-like [Alteracholeplasma palmae J233]